MKQHITSTLIAAAMLIACSYPALAQDHWKELRSLPFDGNQPSKEASGKIKLEL